MNNLQWQILSNIKRLLENSELVQSVGLYPDDVSNIGTYPAVLIIDGDENEYQCFPGMAVTFEYTVSLLLLMELNNDSRIEDILRFQNQIMTLIAKSDQIFANAGAIWMRMVSVSKGDAAQTPTIDALGYLPNLTTRRIDFLFGIEDNNM